MIIHADLAQASWSAVVKTAPPVAVVATTAAGMSWQQGVYVVTTVYVVLQSAYLVYKWIREIRGHKP